MTTKNHSKINHFSKYRFSSFFVHWIPRDTYNHSKLFTFPISNSTFGRTSNQNHLPLPFNALSGHCVNPNRLCFRLIEYINISFFVLISRLVFMFRLNQYVNINRLCLISTLPVVFRLNDYIRISVND